MKTPSTLRTLLVFVVLILLVLGAGMVMTGRWQPGNFFEEPRPSYTRPENTDPQIPPPPTEEPTRDILGEEAVKTVVSYVNALKEGRYTAAYDMLSRDSKKRHAPESFERLGKQGMPLYDLDTARATVSGDRALVAVRLVEDKATHGFNLIREQDRWKVVYRGGIPGAPYAE